MFNNQGSTSAEQDDKDREVALIKSLLFKPFTGAPASFNPSLGLSYGSLLPTSLFALGGIAAAEIEDNRSPSPQTPILHSRSHAPLEIKQEAAVAVRPLSTDDLEEVRSIAASAKSEKNKREKNSDSDDKASTNISMAEGVIESLVPEKKVSKRKRGKIDFKAEYYRLKGRVSLLEDTLNSQQRSISHKNAIIKDLQKRIDRYARDPVLANELGEKTIAAKQFRKWQKESNYSTTLFSASSENPADEKEVEHELSHSPKRKKPCN